MLDYCNVREINNIYHGTNMLQEKSLSLDISMLGIAVESHKLETDIEHNNT